MATKDQRRRQLAREKFERQQQRRVEQRRKARRRTAVVTAGLAVLIAAGATAYAVGGLGGSAKKKTDSAAAPTPSPSASSKAPDPCAKPAAGQPKTRKWKKEPPLTVDKSATYTMTLGTTCGDIAFRMDAGKAPHTVNSFDFLAGKGYFDHTKCHRLTTDGIYVLQCGDPTGTGQGDPGYTIPDENLKDPRLKAGKSGGQGVYPAGTVAMANKGPNTGGSQFFLVYKDSPLPPHYTPFGTVTKGMDVLKKIADAGAAPADPQTQNTAPNATVVIDKATVGKS